MLVPADLNFLMCNFSAGYVWFKLFPVSHNIWGDCNTEIPHKRRSISCVFDDLCIPRLFLWKSKHSEHVYFTGSSHVFMSSVTWLLKSVTVDISLKTRVTFTMVMIKKKFK